jgi:hypothetical protein
LERERERELEGRTEEGGSRGRGREGRLRERSGTMGEHAVGVVGASVNNRNHLPAAV